MNFFVSFYPLSVISWLNVYCTSPFVCMYHCRLLEFCKPMINPFTCVLLGAPVIIFTDDSTVTLIADYFSVAKYRENRLQG